MVGHSRRLRRYVPVRDRIATSLLHHLVALVNESLVIAEGQDATARYRMLETLRQFALEQLELIRGERTTARPDRAWYLELAEHADVALSGPSQADWLHVLERESDNIRAALAWCLESGAIEAELRLAVACSYFWQIRGHRYWSEGRRWLDDGLAAAQATQLHRPLGRCTGRAPSRPNSSISKPR